MTAIRYAPDWVVAILCAEVARRYVGDELPIEAFANKFAQVAQKHYDDCTGEKLSATAEDILRSIADIEDVDINYVCEGFIHNMASFDANGATRKIKTLFSSAYKPAERETEVAQIVKMFRAYLFRLRNDPALKKPEGWSLDKVPDIAWLAPTITQEVTFMDAFGGTF
jgi:hypothetical protein